MELLLLQRSSLSFSASISIAHRKAPPPWRWRSSGSVSTKKTKKKKMSSFVFPIAQLQPQNADLPVPAPKHKKKPWISPPRPGGFLAKLRRGDPKLRDLPTPSNGLLVSRLIPLAHHVLAARSLLLLLLPRLLRIVPVKVCKFCGEVHVGPVGHAIATCNGPDSGRRYSRHVWTDAKVDDVMPQLDAFHLYDRLKTVSHPDRFNAERIPGIVELCIQAGVDIPQYPTLRRTRPVKAIGRQLIEEDTSLYDFGDDDDDFALFDTEKQVTDTETLADGDITEDDEEEPAKDVSMTIDLDTISTRELAEKTLETWMTMRNGVKRLMKKYIVKVCGYCPEVHVGPKGHKVKNCGAFKHQWRAGQHGWQKATIDDFIPPQYVWHVPDLLSPRLENELKRYYGKAPAIVELCVQAGAPIPSEFKPMMRIDVAVPDVTEMYNAV